MADRAATNFTPVYGSGGTINYTDTATNSANLPMGINGVFVTCSTNAWARLACVASGTAPVALTSDFFCPAGASVFLPYVDNTGQPAQLSVVRDASNGAARYTPVV